LQELDVWEPLLLRESGLPGPRGNLELAQAAAEEGDLERFRRYTAFTADRAPTNSPYEFLAFCGVLGLGRLVAEGGTSLLKTLRAHASDSRWRIREAVAMALQRVGDVDMNMLTTVANEWSRGSPLEQRAAAAGLCEPRLLIHAKHARAALRILDRITASVERGTDAPAECVKVLRKGLGYCWSVAVVALPSEGKRLMEKWFASTNGDVRWIMAENLKKKRLVRMDPEWTDTWRSRMKT